MRGADFFVQAAVDAVADAGFLFVGFDVDVRGAFADGVVDEVVDELDDRGVAGDFLEVADVFDLGFDEGEVFGTDFFDDVIDDEDVGGGQVGLHGGGDVALRGGDHLHGVAGELLNFFDQEEVGGLGQGDRQHVVDQKHRQHAVLFDEVARQDFDDFGIADFGRDLGVGDAVDFGEGFAELFFGDEALLDEHFAQQLVAAAGFLLFQRGVEHLLRDQALGDKDLADGLAFCRGRDHEIRSNRCSL